MDFFDICNNWSHLDSYLNTQFLRSVKNMPALTLILNQLLATYGKINQLSFFFCIIGFFRLELKVLYANRDIFWVNNSIQYLLQLNYFAVIFRPKNNILVKGSILFVTVLSITYECFGVVTITNTWNCILMLIFI